MQHSEYTRGKELRRRKRYQTGSAALPGGGEDEGPAMPSKRKASIILLYTEPIGVKMKEHANLFERIGTKMHRPETSIIHAESPQHQRLMPHNALEALTSYNVADFPSQINLRHNLGLAYCRESRGLQRVEHRRIVMQRLCKPLQEHGLVMICLLLNQSQNLRL
eukprot:TRINITY_DN14956_c0_g2_i1.p3 TRINITY_DN14956_c0_g2~~TRINITY_DN14956_c0_g2_i1.p3  ORF type:complete len:164 (+),score=3.90 TRINITY_DN14956_c0_g2_i1:560-1051(+)